MAVTLSDLIAPTGELTEEMFPDMSLSGVIDTWLEEAVAKTVSYPAGVIDQAVKHWVYGRGYRTIARRLALQPNSASAEGISESYGPDRIRYFERLAQFHEDSFEGLGKVATDEPKQIGTQSIVTRVRF